MREKTRRQYIKAAFRSTWVSCLGLISVGGFLGAVAFVLTHTTEEASSFPMVWAVRGAFCGLMFGLLIWVPLKRAGYEQVLDQCIDRANGLCENLNAADKKLADWEKFKIAGINSVAHRWMAHVMDLWLCAAESAAAHATKSPEVNGDFRIVEAYRSELGDLINAANSRQHQYNATRRMVEGLGFTLLSDEEYREMVRANREKLKADQAASEVELLGLK